VALSRLVAQSQKPIACSDPSVATICSPTRSLGSLGKQQRQRAACMWEAAREGVLEPPRGALLAPRATRGGDGQRADGDGHHVDISNEQ
jgi:hypothetical protein